MQAPRPQGSTTGERSAGADWGGSGAGDKSAVAARGGSGRAESELGGDAGNPAKSEGDGSKQRPPRWPWLVVIALALLGLIAALVLIILPRFGSGDLAPPTDPAVTDAAVTDPAEAGATEGSQSEESSPGNESEGTAPADEAGTDVDQSATPAATVLPGCDTLNPDAYAISKDFAERHPESAISYGEVDTDQHLSRFGPAAQQAFQSVTEIRKCTYPIHFEAGVSAYVSVLGESDRAPFLEALRGDSDFVESSLGAATIFVWEEPQIEGHWEAAYTSHVFIGDVWLATFGPVPYEEYTAPMAEAILEANPHFSE